MDDSTSQWCRQITNNGVAQAVKILLIYNHNDREYRKKSTKGGVEGVRKQSTQSGKSVTLYSLQTWSLSVLISIPSLSSSFNKAFSPFSSIMHTLLLIRLFFPILFYYAHALTIDTSDSRID